MPNDGWLIFALGVTVGFIAGWIGHAVYLALWDCFTYALSLARRLYGWHKARDARRIAVLESKVSQLFPDLR
jgi:hypothetical protein